MTLRWRLNFSVIALMAVFLAAAGLTMQAVRANAEQTRLYLRMREASQFTADVRTHIYQRLARRPTASAPLESGDDLWTTSVQDDIEIQIRQSADSHEKQLWRSVRAGLTHLAETSRSAPSDMTGVLRDVEQNLRELRDFYDLSEYRSAVETARGTYVAQVTIGLACALTVFLFLIYLLIVRRWLIRPIQVLKDAAETIGRGHLDHRVPLSGSDELSQLARSIDAMADGLARYQTDLVRSRELSALGELCANVAHGLRNPLAAIRSTAQLAERRAATDDQRQVFQDVSAQADRMDQRITTLFQFSRPIELQYQATAFVEIADSAQAQALPLLKARQVGVEIEDGTGAHRLELDCEQLVQALSELITNAAHHSPPGSCVRLRGDVRGSNGVHVLVIGVCDEGTGMAPATVQKAFDLFFTSRPEGTGIGLTLVRRIVERHGGQVSIESHPGRGTTVTIAVPSRSGVNGKGHGVDRISGVNGDEAATIRDP